MTRRNPNTMTPEERFFWKHAGFSYDPKTETKAQGRRRCAVEMAEAEAQCARIAAVDGWYFEWSADWDIDDSWMTDEEKAKDHTWEVAQLLDENDHVLASLGGIVDADQNYRRVIEAELAMEAIAAYDKETEVLDAH